MKSVTWREGYKNSKAQSIVNISVRHEIKREKIVFQALITLGNYRLELNRFT